MNKYDKKGTIGPQRSTQINQTRATKERPRQTINENETTATADWPTAAYQQRPIQSDGSSTQSNRPTTTANRPAATDPKRPTHNECHSIHSDQSTATNPQRPIRSNQSTKTANRPAATNLKWPTQSNRIRRSKELPTHGNRLTATNSE